MHTTRAQARSDNPKSSYTEHLDRKAAGRMTSFMSENVRALRRLSRIPLEMDPAALQHAMSVYGGGGGGSHDGSSSGSSSSGGGGGGARRMMAHPLIPPERNISSRASSRDRSNRSVTMESLETRSASARPGHGRAESVAARFSPAHERPAHERSASVVSAARMHRKLSISSADSLGGGGGDPMSRGLEALKKKFVV